MKNGSWVLSKSKGTASETAVDIARLYHDYNDRLVGYMRRKLPSTEDPQDYAHDVFIRLVELKDLPDEPHLESLIFRIARAKAVDEYRKKVRRKTDVYGNLDEGIYKVDSPLQDQILEGKQAFARFKLCLNKLPARSKRVFLLHRVARHSQKEIASRLEISVSAIEKHMVKAALNLSQCMEKKHERT